MNKEAFYYLLQYVWRFTDLFTYLLTYLGKSDVYHNKNKYKRYIKN